MLFCKNSHSVDCVRATRCVGFGLYGNQPSNLRTMPGDYDLLACGSPFEQLRKASFRFKCAKYSGLVQVACRHGVAITLRTG